MWKTEHWCLKCCEKQGCSHIVVITKCRHWLNPPRAPSPSLQTTAQWGHQSSLEEPVKPQSTGKSCMSSRANNVTVTSFTRDLGTAPQSSFTPAQVSCTCQWGRERQNKHHTSPPRLWQKENPHSPLTFSTVTFYLGDKWPLGCAVPFTCQKHLSKQGKQF